LFYQVSLKKCFNPVTGNLLEGAFPGDAAETAAGNKAMASIALLRLQNNQPHPSSWLFVSD
jgi:hypothetical protein